MNYETTNEISINRSSNYSIVQISITLLNALINTWPRVHKAFHNQDQDHAQVKQLSTTDFL